MENNIVRLTIRLPKELNDKITSFVDSQLDITTKNAGIKRLLVLGLEAGDENAKK